MKLSHCLLLIGCVIAGAVGCHRNEGAAAGLQASPGRRSIQRASMQADTWQFVICSPDARLRAYADDLAGRVPFGKTVTVVGCEDYRPGNPVIILGSELPEPLSAALNTDSSVRSFLQLQPGDVLMLNNYLNPLTAKDSMPTTFTLYLSSNPDTLLQYLASVDAGSRGGIFRSRWAYEVRGADGSMTMSNYAETGWDFARDEEIHLPAIGTPVFSRQGVAYYAVDADFSSEQLDSVAAYVNGQLPGEEIDRVFLYPSVERIGLRRGSMDPVQREGTDLHLVAEEAFHRATSRGTADHPFLAGMTMAHEGYRVYNGYGGSGVSASLDSLCRMHANAVAIVPYTFMRNAGEMTDFPIPDDAGSENDPAVRHAIRRARERGMFVLLKPQIWVGGGWPGDVNFENEAGWETFFTEYGKWIMHYAELAEQEGAEGLCIGTELVHTTLSHPTEWRTLIRSIRSIYGGKLTYAANWGQEFENVTFWEDLDAIGLNSYYPLAGSSTPSDRELMDSANRWMTMADSISRTYDRPLWLTEVGYRSVKDAWTNPHAEAGDRPASYEDQARCYRALLTAARASDRLEGMFVWKWPSYLGHQEGRGGEDSGYVPGGKPAGALLMEFYSER